MSASVYRLKLETGSADNNALILLSGGALVAILIELADEGHGDQRGRWAVESTFGLQSARRRETFLSAAAAAEWVSDNISPGPFPLDEVSTLC